MPSTRDRAYCTLVHIASGIQKQDTRIHVTRYYQLLICLHICGGNWGGEVEGEIVARVMTPSSQNSDCRYSLIMCVN